MIQPETTHTNPKVPHEVGRIPSLDGVRAVAIILVLISHSFGTENFLSRDWIPRIGDLGNFGVRIFFVLSGFLISTLLFREIGKTGTLSLQAFYIRRAFRILPAFYFFLGIVALLAAVGMATLNSGDLFMASTFIINYRSAVERSWIVGHAWSLAVEEQFYLLWPFILRVFGMRGGLVGCVLAVILVPWLRMSIYWLKPEWLPGMKWEFHTVCDGLATGCLLAYVHGKINDFPRLASVIKSRWILVLALVALITNWYIIGRPRLNFLFGQTLMNFCVASVLLHAVLVTNGWVGRILNCRPMAILGTMSYSIYLWQQLFLDHKSTHAWSAFPLNVILCIGAGLFSYHLIEKPFLRLRSKWFAL